MNIPTYNKDKSKIGIAAKKELKSWFNKLPKDSDLI